MDRITRDPIMTEGTPCIHGMRVTAGVIGGPMPPNYPYANCREILQAIRQPAGLAKHSVKAKES